MCACMHVCVSVYVIDSALVYFQHMIVCSKLPLGLCDCFTGSKQKEGVHACDLLCAVCTVLKVMEDMIGKLEH